MTLGQTVKSVYFRFILGVSAMLLPMFILGIGVFFFMQSIVGSLYEVAEEVVDELYPIIELQLMIRSAGLELSEYSRIGSPARREAFFTLSRDIDRNLNTALAKKYGREDEQSLIKSANAAWLNAKDESQRFFQSPSEANTMESVAQLQNYLQNILDHLAKLTQHAREEVSLELLQAQKLQNMSVGWLIAMFVFAMAIAVLSAMIMGQTILKPLKALEEGVVHLRSGDHSYRVDPPEASELRHLAVTFNTMADEIERNTNMLMEKSKRDSLTSLLNHGEFHNIFKTELERASRYQRPLSLLMLDIDHFKSVNDNYGHPAGDKVIQAIGSVLSKGLRPSDVAARYGGEEFTIILPETEKEKAFYLAERIRNSIAGTQMPLGRNGIISVTVSIGIAAFAENGTLTEDIIEAADQALYKAKKLGRNRTQCA